ncbi:MAG: hypothetical protein HKN25_09745 [Pyrinomonadaceae bacterium]|nr:hypothetical protein [Pyrinomonadaceae bacterium]
MERKMYTYTAYGLKFASEFPVPEFGPEIEGKPDITIKYGKVPHKLSSPSAHGIAWQAGNQKLLHSVAGIARYLIVEDKEIVIEPEPETTEKEVRLFILGSVLGALLHGRKMLVLHASVIKTKNGGVLFMGKSGAGKSTVLGSLLKRGYSMLSDDKAGIVLTGSGVAQVLPAFPTMRLTKKTVEELGYPVNGAEISPGLGKYVIPVRQFCQEPLPVHAAYAITAHNKSTMHFQELDDFGVFQNLNRNTYRRKFVHSNSLRRAHFDNLTALSGQARVVEISRPDDTSMIGEMVDRIEEDMNG